LIFIDEIPTKIRVHFSYLGFKRDGSWKSSGSFGFFYGFKYAEIGASIHIDTPRNLPGSSRPKIAIGMSPELRGQIPLNINNVLYLAPQAFVGAGIFMPSFDYFVHYGAGLEFVPADFTTLSFGADFIARTYLKQPKTTNIGARINVSIRF